MGEGRGRVEGTEREAQPQSDLNIYLCVHPLEGKNTPLQTPEPMLGSGLIQALRKGVRCRPPGSAVTTATINFCSPQDNARSRVALHSGHFMVCVREPSYREAKPLAPGLPVGDPSLLTHSYVARWTPGLLAPLCCCD